MKKLMLFIGVGAILLLCGCSDKESKTSQSKKIKSDSSQAKKELENHLKELIEIGKNGELSKQIELKK